MAQGLVKRFFNEKEVTSTLVMDALFSGCKQVEEASRAGIGPKVCCLWIYKSAQHGVCRRLNSVQSLQLFMPDMWCNCACHVASVVGTAISKAALRAAF